MAVLQRELRYGGPVPGELLLSREPDDNRRKRLLRLRCHLVERKMQDLQGIWCDTEMNDQGCTNFAVTWEGEQIVMTGEYESAGKKFAWRETFARNSEHSLTQTLYVGQPGRDLKLVSTISLAKN